MTAAPSDLKIEIDSAGLKRRIDELALISEAPAPVVTRVLFSEADLRGRRYVREAAQSADSRSAIGIPCVVGMSAAVIAIRNVPPPLSAAAAGTAGAAAATAAVVSRPRLEIMRIAPYAIWI